MTLDIVINYISKNTLFFIKISKFPRRVTLNLSLGTIVGILISQTLMPYAYRVYIMLLFTKYSRPKTKVRLPCRRVYIPYTHCEPEGTLVPSDDHRNHNFKKILCTVAFFILGVPTYHRLARAIKVKMRILCKKCEMSRRRN